MDLKRRFCLASSRGKPWQEAFSEGVRSYAYWRGYTPCHGKYSYEGGPFEITSKRLGVTGVIDDEGFLEGAITDGDLRRAMEKGLDVLNKKASEIMTINPKKIGADALAAEALRRWSSTL